MILVDIPATIAPRLADSLERGAAAHCRIWLAEQTAPPISLSDSWLAISGSLAGVRRIQQVSCSVPIFLFTEHGSEELAIAAFRAGVKDYFHQPSALEEIADAVRSHASEQTAEQKKPRKHADSSIVGNNPKILSILDYVNRVATTDSNILITGETGTGKELVANLIHEKSRRANRPMVSVNCAAIPETLLESELFGYERGAFTGAQSSMAGKLESADGGTIFFDEVADLSPCSQAKLLRITEGRDFHRLGGRKSIKVDVRILAATNHDIDALAMDDRFRKDLYFRLNVGRVHLPPLRDRRSDIPVLLDHYLHKFHRAFGGERRELSPETRQHFLEYSWPGNVRELRNVLESVIVSQSAPRITFHDLPEWFRKRSGLNAVAQEPTAMTETEYERIVSALNATKWNKSKAACQLEWSRMTLYRKMAKYHLKSA